MKPTWSHGSALQRSVLRLLWALPLTISLCIVLASPAAIAQDTDTPVRVATPQDRYDLTAWMEYQGHVGAPSLPAVAQLFYRRGVETLDAGAYEDGVRMLRGAVQLDPTYLAPRTALVQHFAFNNPSQALIELARIVDLTRTHFPLQHHGLTVLAFYLSLALLLGTTLTALFLAWKRREFLRHSYQEFLERKVPRRPAIFGSWILIVLPFLLGFGLAVPVLFTLGALWPWLKKTERTIFVTLLAVILALPIGASHFSALSIPDHPDEGPFYGTVNLSYAPYSDERLNSLRELSHANPDNPILHFSTAWMAQRGGDLEMAKEHFTKAGDLWPNEPRIPNNLGNIAVLEENYDEAERLYRYASTIDDRWAMPHYNLGQLFTRQFRYAEASEELARATSFDFELVRNMQAQAQSGATSPVPLAWGWLAPQLFWDALLADPVIARGLEPPASWRVWFELRGPISTAVALIMTVLGFFIGFYVRKRLPTRMCSNCDRAVCRRCATTYRELVYCKACHSVKKEASAPEFSRLLLLRRRRTIQRNSSRLSTVFSMLIPGWGAISRDHLWIGWLLLSIAGPAMAAFLGAQPPFWYDPRIGPLAPKAFQGGAFALLFAVYALSIAYTLMTRVNENESENESVLTKKTQHRMPRAA